AIIAGLMIIGFGWMWADAITSILISLIIIFGAWRLILESVNILLEGTPPHIDTGAVESAIMSLEGVGGVHDLHIWTISSGMEALSAHITHNATVAHPRLLAAVREKLCAEFGIEHMTIQMETPELEPEAVYVCETGTRCFEPAAKANTRRGRGN
ncbi:MAG TPA: hypothetical protein DEA22_03160, partial [Blastocatellia bacterium]|nr:hypothetical protein [Blastocatellia bacterium]